MNNVHHPKHYNETGIEVIEITDSYELNFCLGNAVKYLLRCGLKHENIQEDVKKAIWYLNHALYASLPKIAPRTPISVRAAMFGRILPKEVENAMYILLTGLGNNTSTVYINIVRDCISSAIIELGKIKW